MNLPDYIVIGETKCGTTSLYNYLIKHPQILDTFGNGEGYDDTYKTKELRFFDKFYERGIDWYKSLFPKAKPGFITGEATPMYMYRSLVAKRIAEHIPNVKLVVVLRDPVDRFISQFYHNFKWVPGFSERYPNIKVYLNSMIDPDYYILEKGMYYYSLIKWMELFNKEQFYVFSSEEMFSEPQSTYNKLVNFLGLEAYKVDEFKKYRSNDYPDVDPEIIKELTEFYRLANQKLFTLVGREFNWRK
jgi:hypothetical protein